MKEKIYDSVAKMDARELNMLYGQIKLIEIMKAGLPERKQAVSIEKIHELTSTSETSWAESVMEDREDRL